MFANTSMNYRLSYYGLNYEVDSFEQLYLASKQLENVQDSATSFIAR